jgi:thiosulfate/3-mercaptopyruvate sulfurtransferase
LTQTCKKSVSSQAPLKGFNADELPLFDKAQLVLEVMMRPFLIALPLAVALLVGVSSAALSTPDGWKPLLEPEELAAILERESGVRVVHVTGNFEAGHIPGAVSAPYAKWRGPPQNPGALRSPEEFGALVRSLGIEADTPVVVVHAGATATDMGAAARVYWTLGSLGVEDLALVNGGFAAWASADLPVSTEPAEVTPSEFVPQWSEHWRVSTEEVEALVDTDEASLVDARPRNFFDGSFWTIARAGTIRGATNLTYEAWFDDTRMLAPEDVTEIAAARGHEASLTVSFCNTGHWAAINWFALSEIAGVPNTRLYAESMAEWTAAGRPLDNAPFRITVYWTQTRNWIEGIF